MNSKSDGRWVKLPFETPEAPDGMVWVPTPKRPNRVAVWLKAQYHHIRVLWWQAETMDHLQGWRRLISVARWWRPNPVYDGPPLLGWSKTPDGTPTPLRWPLRALRFAFLRITGY